MHNLWLIYLERYSLDIFILLIEKIYTTNFLDDVNIVIVTNDVGDAVVDSSNSKASLFLKTP